MTNETRYERVKVCKEVLLEGKYNPHDVGVFLEAIHDECLMPASDLLQVAIREGERGYAELGVLVWSAVIFYCNEMAQREAEERNPI